METYAGNKYLIKQNMEQAIFLILIMWIIRDN